MDAYDLIMKNKELLLDRNPKRSPVRFIFSHSALREGWDNPNVFQICTLKQSGSDIRKRQEVGRGLRLCVNQDGERMDTTVLGSDVHNINVLTVIAVRAMIVLPKVCKLSWLKLSLIVRGLSLPISSKRESLQIPLETGKSWIALPQMLFILIWSSMAQ